MPIHLVFGTFSSVPNHPEPRACPHGWPAAFVWNTLPIAGRHLQKQAGRNKADKTFKAVVQEMAGAAFHRTAFEGSAAAQGFQWRTAMEYRWPRPVQFQRSGPQETTGISILALTPKPTQSCVPYGSFTPYPANLSPFFVRKLDIGIRNVQTNAFKRVGSKKFHVIFFFTIPFMPPFLAFKMSRLPWSRSARLKIRISHSGRSSTMAWCRPSQIYVNDKFLVQCHDDPLRAWSSMAASAAVTSHVRKCFEMQKSSPDGIESCRFVQHEIKLH